MKTVNQTYAVFNSALNQEPRYTVELAFDFASTDLVYFTSHADGDYPSGATVYANRIADDGLSGTTQKLDPLAGAASIGTLTIKLLDYAEEITTLINGKLDGGDGLRGKRMRVYRGFAGEPWSTYELFQTQIVDTVSLDNGVYTFKCADVQRTQRKKIFVLNKTQLSASVGIDDTLIPVAVNDNIQFLEHGPSYSDAPNSTVLYLKVDDEVIRCSGTTTDGTLGLCYVVDTSNARGRGALGTAPAEHNIDDTASSDRRTEVEEFVYLELPLVKLAYAILTGTLYGDGVSLPDNWHLNMSTDYVATSEFVTIGPDWWVTSDDTAGRIGRFTGLSDEDGKKFLETEIYRLLGAFSPVLADGSLGLRRMTRVLADASHIADITKNEIVSNTELTHDMREVANQLRIDWNWDHLKEELTRSNLLIDSNSVSMHGAAPVKVLEFRGLHGSRHTGETINQLFDTLRDRYAGPPQRIKVTALIRNHRIEIGDIVRLTHPDIQDFVTGESIDRSFEVQNISINWANGLVTFDLFGSAQAAVMDAISSTDVLNDTFYTSAGTDIETLPGVTNVSGVIHVASDLDLTGTIGSLLATNSAAILYADGPLQIDSSVTLTCNLATQLRVKGQLQVNGTITAAGNGHAGATAPSVPTGYNTYSPSWYTFTEPTDPGVETIGATASQGGVVIGDSHSVKHGHVVSGSIPTLPYYTLENNDGDSIDGLPDALIGIAGSSGGHSAINGGTSADTFIKGGDGGDSGGGLLIICRGFDIGVSGQINTSGSNGGAGTSAGDAASGAGAGGYPGGVVVLLDGDTTYPTGLSRILCYRGVSPYLGSPVLPNALTDHPGRLVSSGYEESAFSLFDARESMVRIQYIPPYAVAEEDVPTVASAPTAISVTEYANTPQTPAENLASLEIGVTPPSPLGSYAYSNVYYKLPAQSAWIYIGPADNETVVTLPMDGTTYDVKAVPVSIFGVESTEFITDSHTVTSGTGGVALGNGNYISYNKTGFSDDASVGFWLGVDGLIAKFNLGDGTNSLKWDGADLTITGIINALSGGNLAGWTINADTIESPNGRIILDSTNQRIRVENVAGTNYIDIDGDGITAHDATLGTTVSIPTDGSAPTFSSGTIKEMIYEIYTSGVIRTAADPASTGGVLINNDGIQVFNSGGTRTAFLDGVSSAHEFSGTISVTENSITTIKQPGGGSYSHIGSITGAIVIKLPQSWTSTMMRLFVDVYLYSTSEAFTIACGGYNYTAGSAWTQNFAQIVGNTGANNRVRFGHDGTVCCIVIGETTSGWAYPNIVVRDFQAGFSNTSASLWRTGWAVSVDSSLAGITFSGSDFSDTLLDAKAILNQGVMATEDSADWSTLVTGTGKPSDNADVTQSAINTGVTLTSGYLKRGTDEILIDWANVRETIGDETYKGVGIQLEYNGGTPRAHIGDGDTKFIEFDGTDLVLGEDTVLRGAPSIADISGEYFETYFESIDGWFTLGTSGGTIGFDSSKSQLELYTPATAIASALIAMTRWLAIATSSWLKNKLLVARVRRNGAVDDRIMTIVMGNYGFSTAATCVGFELDFSKSATSAWIRGGITHTGASASYTSYAGSASTDQYLTLMSRWDAATNTAYYYVNGTLIGSLTDSDMSTYESDYLVGARVLNGASPASTGVGALLKLKYWQEGEY